MAVPAGWGDEARARGGSHHREPPGCPGHVRATRPNARTRCRQLGEGVLRLSGPGDERRGRRGSTMKNEGMINVQIARIDDALSRLARLEPTSTSKARCNNSQGQHRLQERVEERGELRDEEWTCSPRLGQRREDGHRAGGRAHGLCHRVDRWTEYP